MNYGCARFPCGGHAGGCAYADCINNQYRNTLPQPVWNLTTPPPGCICPPTSEKTCENSFCPRKDIKISAAGPVSPANQKSEA